MQRKKLTFLQEHVEHLLPICVEKILPDVDGGLRIAAVRVIAASAENGHMTVQIKMDRRK